MDRIALAAGLMSTALFVTSYLPMLYRAWRTKDLDSYSRPSLVLANVGNLIQAVYVYSLPLGPIWFLHGFYLAASAVMLGLHVRHGRSIARSSVPSTRPVDEARHQQGART